jgi:hypothetical protein
MSKLFTIAGYSNLNGRVKLRVATGTVARRVAVLKLVELPTPMTREDARAFVESQFKGVELFKSKVAAPKSVDTAAPELDIEVELESENA